MNLEQAKKLIKGQPIARRREPNFATNCWTGSVAYEPSPAKQYVDDSLVYQISHEASAVKRRSTQVGRRGSASYYIDVQIGSSVESKVLTIVTAISPLTQQEQTAA